VIVAQLQSDGYKMGGVEDLNWQLMPAAGKIGLAAERG
jgi:hypothetical protein